MSPGSLRQNKGLQLFLLEPFLSQKNRFANEMQMDRLKQLDTSGSMQRTEKKQLKTLNQGVRSKHISKEKMTNPKNQMKRNRHFWKSCER